MIVVLATKEAEAEGLIEPQELALVIILSHCVLKKIQPENRWSLDFSIWYIPVCHADIIRNTTLLTLHHSPTLLAGSK